MMVKCANLIIINYIIVIHNNYILYIMVVKQ